MKSRRREFLKTATILGSGAILLSETRPAHAGQNDRKPAAPADLLQNPTLKTIHSLRSIHGNFTDRTIPDAALQAILGACVRAANAANNQSYAIIAVKDRKKMAQICGYSGSCLLVFCADYNRMKAAQTAVIAAKSMGIDSLLTNGIHRDDMTRLWTLLDLPEMHCFPVVALVLGYPTAEPPFMMGRLTGTGVVHDDNYHHLTEAEVGELIQKYDRPAEHLALGDGWGAKGYKHYLDWYFKEWATRNAGEESQILRILKRSGFVEATKG